MKLGRLNHIGVATPSIAHLPQRDGRAQTDLEDCQHGQI